MKNESMVTPESALVKTQPGTWVVVEPDEQAAIRSLAPLVFDELSRRLNSGSPFETAAGAWQGEEPVASEGPVTASIQIVGKDSIYVHFFTRSLDFGKLAIGKRLSRNCYEVYLSEPGFFAWIERLSPPPRTPAELAADELKAAHPELAARVDKALALVQAGQIEFPHYQTGAMLTTNPPTRRCSCPDAEHRAPQIAGIGQACKHCLAQHIAETVRQQSEATAYRKLTDKLDALRRAGSGVARRRDTALPVWAGRNESLEDWVQ